MLLMLWLAFQTYQLLDPPQRFTCKAGAVGKSWVWATQLLRLLQILHQLLSDLNTRLKEGIQQDSRRAAKALQQTLRAL